MSMPFGLISSAQLNPSKRSLRLLAEEGKAIYPTKRWSILSPDESYNASPVAMKAAGVEDYEAGCWRAQTNRYWRYA